MHTQMFYMDDADYPHETPELAAAENLRLERICAISELLEELIADGPDALHSPERSPYEAVMAMGTHWGRLAELMARPDLQDPSNE